VPPDVRAAPAEIELLRTIVDRVSAMLAYWDSSQRCRFANRAYERWFGVTPESLIGKHISELLGPLYPLNLPYIERVLRGEPQEFEREIPDPAGGPARHSLACYIPDVADGVVRGFFVMVTDISGIKRAELALRQSEQRFELALEGGDLASWDWNIATGEVVFNRRWAEMRGYRPEEIRPHVDSWTSGLHPDDRAPVERALADHFDRRTAVYETEHRVRTRSGQWMWILDRGKVFERDAQGRPARMVGTELDITDRKRVEAEHEFLAEAAMILASTLDLEDTLAGVARLAVRQLADCVIVDVVEAEDAVQRLLVAHADPARARLAQELERIPLDRRRPHLASAILETAEPTLMSEIDAGFIESVAQGEDHLRLLRELDPRSMMAIPLRVHQRLLGGLLFISSTPARRYARSDLELAVELGQRAAIAIEHARLYDTARRATRMRDDVLGIVAHDLRNPLHTILMHTALLRRRGDEPERRSPRPVDAIERAAKRMDRLIEDLLDVTRMEAGHLSVEPKAVATRQVVSDSVEAQEALATAASLELRVDMAGALPEVWVDRDRLLQVFENLIGNALKFTRAGGVVTVGAAARDGGEVLFWVSDTGAGIAPDQLAHVFDRFWQSRKVGRRGAGLGLTIVRGIVEAHGGRIWAQSTPGEGSTFFFTMPTASGADARRPARTSPSL
jgi:PAS domain S-box-containing protein